MDRKDVFDPRRRRRAEPAPLRDSGANHLQNARPPIYSEDGVSLIQAYLHTIKRRRWLVAAFALAGAVLGVITTINQLYIYRARTSMEVQTINEDFMNLRAVDPTNRFASSNSESLIQTQMKLLQSDSLLKRVGKKMRASTDSGGRNSARQLGTLLSDYGLQSRQTYTRDALIEQLSKHVTVKPIGMTRLVEVSCESADPKLAAEFCNTLGEEFVSQDLELRWSTAQSTIQWIENQLKDVRSKLEDSERKLQAFAQDNSLFFNQEKESVAQDKLRRVQGELSQAQADRIAREAQYKISSFGNADSLPSILDDEPSRQSRVKLAELQRSRAELGTAFTPESPQVRKVDAQIKALESNKQTEQKNLVQRLRNEYEAAMGREQALAQVFAQQETLVSRQIAKTAQLNMLYREAESGRQVYTALLQKVREAGFASAMKSSPIRIVDKAIPPVEPTSPSRRGRGVLGLAAGLFAGIAFAFFKERTDSHFRVPGDVRKHCLLPEFGVIPSARRKMLGDRSEWRRRIPGRGPEPALLINGSVSSAQFDNKLELVTWTRKRSLMAEAYRSAMSSILFSDPTYRRRTILISSPTMGDGKTTLTTNLAIAFAETGRRVVIVDGDLRVPRLHRIFGINNDYGLQNVLCERDLRVGQLGPLVQPTMVPNLFVLPAGTGVEDPHTLLHSKNISTLFQRLNEEFDAVLIDSPPLLHLSDARTLAQFATGVVLVFRAGKVTREMASHTLQRLEGDRTPVLGVILNDFDAGKEGMPHYYDDYHRYQRNTVLSAPAEPS